MQELVSAGEQGVRAGLGKRMFRTGGPGRYTSPFSVVCSRGSEVVTWSLLPMQLGESQKHRERQVVTGREQAMAASAGQVLASTGCYTMERTPFRDVIGMERQEGERLCYGGESRG